MKPPSLSSPLRVCHSPHWADLAGRPVALSADIPLFFDTPLAPQHKLIGRWAVARDTADRVYSRPQGRRRIERVFDAAVRDILDPVELADLRIAVLSGMADAPPAIAIICQSIGQLDLGWIETGDAPIPWRAAAYIALEQTLGCALPVFGYRDLFDEISMYYWEGETDDEGALRCLVAYHGADPDDLDEYTLPSVMNARRPDWMIGANAARSTRLPAALRQTLRKLHQAHDALGRLPPERNAWRLDTEIVCDYIPDFEECVSVPPLTLVPVEQFAREIDDVARHGMEMGFMDVAGICPLPDADHIDHWFASLRLGARYLLAAQELIRFDPANP